MYVKNPILIYFSRSLHSITMKISNDFNGKTHMQIVILN